MSIVSNSIINADAEARYLSPGELDQIKAFVTGGQRRLRVAQVLCESRERIVKQAGGQLFQKRPDVISPGGNAYGEEVTPHVCVTWTTTSASSPTASSPVTSLRSKRSA